ncbi:MAG: GGDEF domain-containing protein [Treponema sp.]|nr:GGDEF domain-containing protein [Treponema sp.]
MRRRFSVKQLFRIFFWGTTKPDMWNSVKDMVSERNYSALSFFSILYTFALAVVSVVSFYVPELRRGVPIYLCSMLISIILLFVCRFAVGKQHSHAVVLLLLYVLVFLSCLFGIAIGRRWTDPKPAVTFMVLIVIAPFIICDEPWRIDLALLAVLGIFVWLDYMQKPAALFQFDFLNALTFYVISVFVNTYNQVRYMKEFRTAMVIRHQRDTDFLTGVLTKRAFENYVYDCLEEDTTTGTMMIIDIDNFKSVNDSLGHAVGDQFISHTGATLLTLFRHSDKVGRFGGDEFVVFVPGFVSEEKVMEKAEEVCNRLHVTVSEELNYDSFSVSIGATFFHGGDDYELLFAQMDAALYEAKRSGKNCCKIFKK